MSAMCSSEYLERIDTRSICLNATALDYLSLSFLVFARTHKLARADKVVFQDGKTMNY